MTVALHAIPPTPPSADYAAELLRERIIAGELPRGQSLDRGELAGNLGVSAGAASRAVRLLLKQNYLARRGRHLVVAPLRLQAHDLVKERLLLESHLARRAARRIGVFDLHRLERQAQRILEAQGRRDVEAVQRANYHFHLGLYRIADQPEGLQRVQTLWAGFPFDMLTSLPSRMAAVAEEHAAVLHALRQTDPAQVGRAMREHITQGWQAFLRHYARCPSIAGAPDCGAPGARDRSGRIPDMLKD